MTVERAAIVGTFGTWRETPWSDPGLRIATLNDAWTLGMKRIDEMYELHPLDKMWFRKRDQKQIRADLVPPGYFVRPEGHIEYLKDLSRSIPVWLKDTPPAGWGPNARRFPLEYLEQQYGAYWASGPSYMATHLIDRGVKELHIYGIHLATQDEYVRQRPNWESILRAFIGLRHTVILKDGKRYYEGSDTKHVLVMPESCPILTHGWKYGYEPSPQPDPRKLEIQQLQQTHAMLMQKLAHVSRFANKGPLLDRLRRVSARIQDVGEQMGKAQSGSTVRVPVIAA